MSIISNRLYLYSSSSYSQIDTPPEERQSIEFAPSDVDLLRYRTGFVYGPKLNYTKNINPNAASIAYKFVSYGTRSPISIDQRYSGPYKNKEILTLTAINRNLKGSFAAHPNDSDNFNFEPSVNNWCNSFGKIDGAGIDNPSNIIGSITDEIFSDHGLIFNFAVDERYKKLVNNPPGMNGASVDVVYNYYNKTYENVMNYQSYSGSVAQTSEFELDEKLLPSYYTISALLGDFDIVSNPGSFQNDAYRLFFFDLGMTGLIRSLGFISAGTIRISLKDVDFFTEYSRKLFSIANSNGGIETILANAINKQKNVVLQQSQLTDLINDTDDILSDLPMYTKISFDVASVPTSTSGDVISEFISRIGSTNLSSRFIIANTNQQDYSSKSFNIVANDGVPFVPDDLYDGSGTSEKLKCFNVSDKFASRDIENDNHFIAGIATEEYNIATSTDFPASYVNIQASDIVTNLNNQAGDINNINSYRTFMDLTQRQPAPNFPIFYRVEKWAVDSNNNPLGTEPIQNFYVPNFDNSVDRVNIYDTQIRYGKTYIYRIYAMNLTIGTDYTYSIQDIVTPIEYNLNNSTKQLAAEICAETKPNIKIIQTPYYQKLVTILDKPPLSPNVGVYPYFNNKNKIKILLNGRVGTELAMPISLRPGDQTIFNGIRNAFNLGPNEKIEFKSDDPSVKFDIFRLDFRPVTYDEFQFADYTQIETTGFKNPYKKAASAALEDFLEPNKKYYYTFRSVDVHGKVSNPSPVYEIEISYDGASAFLLTNIISLNSKKNIPQSSTKKMKKFLRIKPAYNQTILNQKASGIVDSQGNLNPDWFPTGNNVQQNQKKEIKLGDEQNSLWGQTFKIRLISKKTGKKVDLNVNFKTKKVIIDEKDVNNIS